MLLKYGGIVKAKHLQLLTCRKNDPRCKQIRASTLSNELCRQGTPSPAASPLEKPPETWGKTGDVSLGTR